MHIEACRYGETKELEYLVYKHKVDERPQWVPVSQLRNAKAALLEFMKRDEKSKRQKRTVLPAKRKDEGGGNSAPVKRAKIHARSHSTDAVIIQARKQVVKKGTEKVQKRQYF